MTAISAPTPSTTSAESPAGAADAWSRWATQCTPPARAQARASLALEDAQALAVCLREEADHEAAFARYQAVRQPRADKVVDYARKINSQKRVSKSRVAVAIRDAMLPLFSQTRCQRSIQRLAVQLPRNPGPPAQSVLVEASLGDVLHDAVRHQVPDRLHAAAPEVGMLRRRSPCRDLEQGDFVLGQLSDHWRIEFNSRPGTADKVGKIENRIDFVPGKNLRQRIRTSDEVHVHVVAALDAQIAQGIRGVGRPGRSMSTRLTVNLGLDAVAMTVIK